MSDFVDLLTRDRVLPLLTARSPEQARSAVERLAARGLGLLEIPLRTEAAEQAIAACAGGPVLIGAGTVLHPRQVDRVVELGARFVVSPGLGEAVVDRCRELDLPVLPGIATPTEAQRAMDLGLDLVKLFPAAVLGGPAWVRALAGPFPRLRMVPSGGIDAASAPDYLALSTVLAVSGSWLVEADA